MSAGEERRTAKTLADVALQAAMRAAGKGTELMQLPNRGRALFERLGQHKQG